MSNQDLASIDGEITLRHAIAWLLATWRRRVLIGLGVLVPLALGLAGGYGPAPVRDLPRIAPGQSVEIGPFDLALQEYFVSDEVHTRYLPEEADAWLGVVFTATGTHDQSAALHRQALTFPDGLGLIDEDTAANPTHRDMLRIGDGTLLHNFEPGLTVQAVSLLPVQDASAVPEEITLQVTDLESAWSFLLESESWYERERVGQVTLSRTEVVPAQLEMDEE